MIFRAIGHAPAVVSFSSVFYSEHGVKRCSNSRFIRKALRMRHTRFLVKFECLVGEDDLNSPARLLNFTTPSTSSSSTRSSTAKPESFSSPTLLNASSKGDLSVNTTRSQSFNDTTDSTVAPGADEPRLNTLAPINSTTVVGNLTNAQDDLSVGNNQTSTISSTSFTNTTNTTNTPLPGPITSTSAPTLSQSLSSTTGPQITTSPSATTTQSRGNSTTVTTKDTASAPTTRTISTTTTTTTAQAKSVDSSELNVGDDTEWGVLQTPLFSVLYNDLIYTNEQLMVKDLTQGHRLCYINGSTLSRSGVCVCRHRCCCVPSNFPQIQTQKRTPGIPATPGSTHETRGLVVK
ncbi:hypothetical protein C0J50_16912 [Silurus asotus]|uniref:Uncharacterized protein n=1 Tax=Silurus asotus TaxID=30991 RepID=A0AAD5AV23_SILAS|nr:hypothetical protein C0J50_16912 [Silurus asotus]